MSSPSASSPYYSFVFGVGPGDNISIRVRADRADGTVSDYQDVSVTGPAPDDNGGSPSSTQSTIQQPTLSGPSTSDVPGEWGTATISPYVNSADPNDTDFYDDLYSAVRQNDPLNIENDGVAGYGNVSGTTGATYSLTGFYFDYTSGEASPKSAPLTVKLGGTLPPKLSLSLGQPDANGDPTVTWQPPPGVDSYTVYFYTIGTDGKAQEIADDETNADYDSAAFFNLPAGKTTVFAIYNGQSDDGQINGYSPYSNDVTISAGGPPAAPATITAVLDPSGDEIDVHWQNTPNDETGYEVLRSTGGGFEQIGETGADGTSFSDHISGETDPAEPRIYEVVALPDAGSTSPDLVLADAAPDTGPSTGPTTSPASQPVFQPLAPDYKLRTGNNLPNGGALVVAPGGRYQWLRTFTVPQNPVGGVIIQHVTFTVNGQKVADYWEAFSLPPGITQQDDDFDQNSDHQGFTGTIVETGEATFYPGGAVPAGWNPNAHTGGLPQSNEAPSLPPGPKLKTMITATFPALGNPPPPKIEVSKEGD